MQDDTDAGSPGDRSSHRRPEPDAYGQAALLLSESILHALIDAGTLTLAQANDAVRIACELKAELAEELGESGDRMRQSLGLLSGIGLSLAVQDRSDHQAG